MILVIHNSKICAYLVKLKCNEFSFSVEFINPQKVLASAGELLRKQENCLVLGVFLFSLAPKQMQLIILLLVLTEKYFNAQQGALQNA